MHFAKWMWFGGLMCLKFIGFAILIFSFFICSIFVFLYVFDFLASRAHVLKLICAFYDSSISSVFTNLEVGADWPLHKGKILHFGKIYNRFAKHILKKYMWFEWFVLSHFFCIFCCFGASLFLFVPFSLSLNNLGFLRQGLSFCHRK